MRTRQITCARATRRRGSTRQPGRTRRRTCRMHCSRHARRPALAWRCISAWRTLPAEIIFGRSNNGAPARARRMHAGETASPMSAAYATCDTHVSAAARRPQRACLRSPTTPARTTHTQARRLHTRTNGQRTRRTRLLADAARNIYCATFIRWNDGCRWNALHSLPPPSLDTHGPRVRVALR